MKEHGGPVSGEHLKFSGAVAEKRMTRKGFICQAKEFELELEQEEPKRFPSLEATGFVF